MAQEASLIFSLAFELRDLYEKKTLNMKSKVKSLTDAVDQICARVVLDGGVTATGVLSLSRVSGAT